MLRILFAIILLQKNEANILYTETEFPKTKAFLKTLESTEKFNYVQYLKIGTFNYSDEIMSYLKSPKTIVSREEQLNYLNLPKLRYRTSLKYYFNFHYMVVILIEQIMGSTFPYTFIYNMTAFSIQKVIVVFIANSPSNEYEQVFDFMYYREFVNVIYFDIESFEKNGTFLTFTRFPDYKIYSTSSFVREDLTNIKGKYLKILCTTQTTFSVCEQKNNITYGYGRFYHMAATFAQFVHGNVDLIYRQEDKMGVNITHDIRTYLNGFSNLEYLEEYPILSENSSYPVGMLTFHMAIPKSHLIDPKYYLVKPFDWTLWLSSLAYVIFGSTALYYTFKSIGRIKSYWLISNQLFRTLMAQSFTSPIQGVQMTGIYTLAFLVGFVITVWYSAILGSLLTTNLYEPQVRTLDDMRRIGMKYVHKQTDYYMENYMSGYKETRDLAVSVPAEEYLEFTKIHNSSAAIMLMSSLFEFPDIYQYYIKSDHILEYLFHRVEFIYSSNFWTARYDTHIRNVVDSGLYDYWLRNYDIYKAGFYRMLEPQEPEQFLRILDINFFKYPFLVLFIGLTAGGLVFLFEITIFKNINLMILVKK